MTNQGSKAIDTILAESFKELTVKKPIEKITIREITDLAGVIRPTFYNHFQDKYELLEWIVHNELIIPMDEKIKKGDIRGGAILALSSIKNNPEFYKRAARLEGQNSFKEILNQQLSGMIMGYIDEEALKKNLPHDWLTPERTVGFFAQSLVFAINEWIESGMSVSEDEIVDIFITYSFHSIVDLLSKVR